MKRPAFLLCQTPKESSEVFFEHFRTLYGRQAHFDESVHDDLLQHPIFEGCDHLPTGKEIIDATHKLKNEAPGESGIMAQIRKNLLDCRETFSMLKSIIIKFGVTEINTNVWNIGRLIVLLKKRDLSL